MAHKFSASNVDENSDALIISIKPLPQFLSSTIDVCK
jgi:hypothetical protein